MKNKPVPRKPGSQKLTPYEWQKLRKQCCAEADKTCEKCGRETLLNEGELHHKNGTRGLGGGKNDVSRENLAWICHWCHQAIHERQRFGN